MLAKISFINMARPHLLSQEEIKLILDILPAPHLKDVYVIV